MLSVPRCCGVVIKNSYVCVWNRSKFLFDLNMFSDDVSISTN